MGTSGLEEFKTRRRRLSAVNAREVAHMDQANNAAIRRLIPPAPRPCWLALSVTTPLYSTKYLQVNIESPRLPADADRALRPASIQLPSRRIGVASGNL